MHENTEITEPGAPELKLVAFRHRRELRQDGNANAMRARLKRWADGSLSDEDRECIAARYDTRRDTIEVTTGPDGYQTACICGKRAVDVSRLSDDARTVFEVWQHRRLTSVLHEVYEATGISVLAFRSLDEIEAT